MTRSSGRWDNAPVVYVLAQVRTERIAELKKYLPDFGGQLRDDYPIQREMRGAKLIATPSKFHFEPEEDSAWEFAAPDNRTAVILRPTGLVLHATHYDDEAEFLERLDKVTTLFEKEIPAVYVNRLGMRYIDFVLPRADENLGAYMVKELNPDLGLVKAGTTATMSLAIYPMAEKRQLIVRFTSGFGKPQLPPDLGPLALEAADLMKIAVDEKSATAVLDTDCGIEYLPVRKLDSISIKEDFDAIYKDLFDAFKKSITPHARSVWGEKT